MTPIFVQCQGQSTEYSSHMSKRRSFSTYREPWGWYFWSTREKKATTLLALKGSSVNLQERSFSRTKALTTWSKNKTSHSDNKPMISKTQAKIAWQSTWKPILSQGTKRKAFFILMNHVLSTLLKTLFHARSSAALSIKRKKIFLSSCVCQTTTRVSPYFQNKSLSAL